MIDQTYALIGGNLILLRGDGELVSEFRARARRLALSIGCAPLVWVNEPVGASVIDRMLCQMDERRAP
jgi:hypothetical protein